MSVSRSGMGRVEQWPRPRVSHELPDVSSAFEAVGWVALVIAELFACWRMIVEDLAARIDPAEAGQRWASHLQGLAATIERAAGTRSARVGAEVEPDPALDETDGQPAWDFGDAFALLTDRQAAVVSLLLRDFRPAQIAEALSITRHTVYEHRRDAVKQLRADGSPGALKLAQRCSRFERPPRQAH